MIETDIWPAGDGLSTFHEFEESRLLTQRALQRVLTAFHKKYFKGGERVLEIGSGTSFLYQNWPSIFKGEWIQLEPQPAFIQEARLHLPSERYLCASTYHLPFADESIDVVCGSGSFDVLHHLEDAVQEMYRVLKPGGLLFHLLDLNANDLIVQRDFQQRRIPFQISSQHTQPHFPGIMNTRHVPRDRHYIPPENIPKFLTEVGMTQAEMDTLPEIYGEFAFSAFKRKMRRKESRDQEPEDSDPFGVNHIIPYFNLFRAHARAIDANAYFTDKLTSALAQYFGEQQVTTTTLSSSYRGRRTPHQQTQYPTAFVFDGKVGLIQLFPCLLSQALDYHLYQRSPRLQLSSWGRFLFEPTCVETATLDAVIARKPLKV